MKTAIRWFITGLYAVCWAIFMPMLAVFNFLIEETPRGTRSRLRTVKELVKCKSI